MGESSSMEVTSSISWTVRLEEYFASTGEKASGLAWVHKRAEAVYSNRRTYIDLPIIIGSGVIAFLNAGSQSLFTDQRIASTALGVGSLWMGILNSFGTYFGWSKRAEGHRISAIHYAKLCRFISVELSLPRGERMSPHSLLKYVKDQYDRLAEISPMVPDIVIRDFQNRFKHEKVSKPEETNGLHKIDIYKDVDDDESMKEMPDIKSPIRNSASIEDILSPKALPIMTIRVPEVKKVEAKKNSVEGKQTVSVSDVTVEISKPKSPPHED